MAFLGYDEDNFIYTLPLVFLSLFVFGLERTWSKKLGVSNITETYTVYNIYSSLIKIFLFWLYTVILVFYKCKKSDKDFDFKKSWKPTLVLVSYYIAMIILNFIPIFPFGLINTLINNFLGMYIVAALVWYPVLKSTYDECF